MIRKPVVAVIALLTGIAGLAGCTGSPQELAATPAPVPVTTLPVTPAPTTIPTVVTTIAWTEGIPATVSPDARTYTFKGSGDYVHTFTTTDDRTWVFRMSYPGDRVFLVRLQDSNGRDIDILADEDSVFAGTESVWLVAGTYNLDVTADTSWVITMSTV